MMTIRSDGRTEATTLRSLSCEMGIQQNCDGSAIWKSGRTTIMASVHGPIAPKQQQQPQIMHYNEDPTTNGCLVSVVIKTGNSGSNNTLNIMECETFITQQLLACIVRDVYVKCVISVSIQIMVDDGSILSTAFHAAIAACIDATIEMKYIPTCITTCCFCSNAQSSLMNTTLVPTTTTTKRSSSIILLDPTYDEEISNHSCVMVIVFLPKINTTTTTTVDIEKHSSERIIGCYTSIQKISSKQFIKSCTMASYAVPAIQAFWRLALEKS